ncbi:hypothetical protein [Bradyrhizobium ivorense]|uniref:hypothetical protein n=1 Tax=Bradyrhizobium ivorense TaxID=2511166 RepID=UPI0011179889|nr:hypothetical protein [Bradyrhizobium ivorense]
MSKRFAVNETENCIAVPASNDALVRRSVCRRPDADDRAALRFDATTTAASRVCALIAAKILSSLRDAIVEIIAALPTTFEIPFH